VFFCNHCREPRDDGHPDCAEHRRVAAPELDGLTLIEFVDKGGFGKVYKCRGADGRLWALKVLDLRPARRLGEERLADLRGQYKTEVRVLAGLKHRRIVPYGVSGTAGDFLFMTMGFADRSLEVEVIGEPWPLDRALPVLCQLADALAYLHARDVAHRDLKPGNLGLDGAGDLLLFDFGIAALRGQDFRRATRTAHGLGTPGYAAPEQLFGLQSGLAADLYAFGALAYELLAGRPHLEGEAPAALQALTAWYRRRPPALPADTDRPPRLDWLIECCLREPPGERPAGAKEVQEELDAVLRWRGLERAHAERRTQADALRGEVEALTRQRDTLSAVRGELEAARRELSELKTARSAMVPVSNTPGLWRRLAEALRPRPGHRLTMVPIPGGTFLMGSPADEPGRFGDEGQHRVTVSSFLMAATPVTESQFGGLGWWRSNRQKRHPKANVRWEEAVAWCNRLSRSEGLTEAYAEGDLVPGADGYRLPTEAEWEYACRAGTQTSWWTGADEASLDRAAWYDANAGGTTHPVGEKAANAWGLYDVHGNVWEWCHDWFADYLTEPQTDPTGPPTGDWRVIRGGGFDVSARWVRAADRVRVRPGARGGLLGFRVVRRPRP